MGLGVMRPMADTSSRASTGEPSASITTTPSGVTTNAALEMKLRFAGEPSAEAPWTIQIPGWTSTGSTACAPAAAVASASAPAAPRRKALRQTRPGFTDAGVSTLEFRQLKPYIRIQ